MKSRKCSFINCKGNGTGEFIKIKLAGEEVSICNECEVNLFAFIIGEKLVEA